MKISESGFISIDGIETGLGVSQHIAGTFVYIRSTGRVIKMPYVIYTINGNEHYSGAASREQFLQDICAELQGAHTYDDC